MKLVLVQLILFFADARPNSNWKTYSMDTTPTNKLFRILIRIQTTAGGSHIMFGV